MVFWRACGDCKELPVECVLVSNRFPPSYRFAQHVPSKWKTYHVINVFKCFLQLKRPFCRLAPAPVTVETAAAAPWFHDAHHAGVRWAPMPRGWGGSLPQETSRCWDWEWLQHVTPGKMLRMLRLIAFFPTRKVSSGTSGWRAESFSRSVAESFGPPALWPMSSLQTSYFLHLFTGDLEDLEVQNLKLFLETFTSCKKVTVGLFVCPGKILSESIFHFPLLHVWMQKKSVKL